MTEVQRRFLAAFERGAPAAELDALLIDVHTEHRIRRNALDLARGSLPATKLTLLADIVEAGLQLRDTYEGDKT